MENYFNEVGGRKLNKSETNAYFNTYMNYLKM